MKPSFAHFETVLPREKIQQRKDLADGHTIMVNNIGAVCLYNTQTGKRLAKINPSAIDDIDAFIDSLNSVD